MGEEPNDRELITTRVLSAAPAVVFDAWTNPEHLTHWWGPDGFATTTHALALRPGGAWRFTMHGPDGRDYQNRVEFVEVIRPSRLVYRHRDDGETEPVDFHVTVTFAPLGTTKTLLTMRAVFDTPEELLRIEDAYEASLGQLQTLARLADFLLRNEGAGGAVPRSDEELATSRLVRATPDRVFDAFRDPEKLAAWWGPQGFTNTFHEFDFRPRGVWKLTMHGPDGKDFPNESVFVATDEPRRIVLDHHSKPTYRAEFVLSAVPEGTRVAFFQRFESAEICRRIAKFAGTANDENLERLAALVERAAAAP